MPAYNASATIEHSIRSVLAQTYPHWELLVVDDGSTDATVDIARRVSAGTNMRLLEIGGRMGPAAARNAALKIASGRWIAFLDSDDLWLPEKLERQLAFMRKTGAALSFTAYRRMNETGRMLPRVIEVPTTVSYRQLLRSNCIGCLTAMFDRQRFAGATFPDLGLLEDHRWIAWLGVTGRVGHEDYGLWLSLLRDDGSGGTTRIVAHGLNEPLALYRVGTTSFSGNKLRAAAFQWTLYRRTEKLPFLRSAYLFAHYAARGLFKRIA